MRNILKTTFIFLSLFTLTLNAVEENQIQSFMDQKVKEVLATLKDKSLSDEQKKVKNIAIIDQVFDYAIMSQISLGRAWKNISDKEKKAFIAAFANKIKLSYLDKLKLYNNQTVTIEKMNKVKSNRITVEAEIVGIDDTYKVVYLFYKKKNNDWAIYDVELIGVSLIQTYRKQFAEFLKEKSMAQLIDSL